MDENFLTSSPAPPAKELSAQPTEGACAPDAPLPTPPCGATSPKGEARSFLLKFVLCFLPPVLLTALFYAKEGDRAFMDRWVDNCLTPCIQAVGKFWSIFPFSVAEVMAALFIAVTVLGTVHTLYILVKKRLWKRALKRAVSFLCLLCWLWCGFCWLWNCTYRATGFAEEYDLPTAPYTPEQLLEVTILFAWQAAELSTQVPRNEDLSFAVPTDELFERAVSVYDNIGAHFPSLDISHRRAKPILFSRLQSILGYTGIYFPFTGESNVNVDQTGAFIPFTIAHEMAHQRMVAAEQECNFVGVLSCISSEDVVFQYSGWLMGLVYLTNAIFDISPELGQEIMNQTFTDELRKDWNDNYDYWQALSSPVQEKASQAMDQVYDGYLKNQGQALGLMSYNACVDLLVNYFYIPG